MHAGAYPPTGYLPFLRETSHQSRPLTLGARIVLCSDALLALWQQRPMESSSHILRCIVEAWRNTNTQQLVIACTYEILRH